MYRLVSRVSGGLEGLESRFESHVHSQGMAAVEKCLEAASSVSWEVVGGEGEEWMVSGGIVSGGMVSGGMVGW